MDVGLHLQNIEGAMSRGVNSYASKYAFTLNRKSNDEAVKLLSSLDCILKLQKAPIFHKTYVVVQIQPSEHDFKTRTTDPFLKIKVW